MEKSPVKQTNQVEVVEYDTRPDEAIVIESLCPKCQENGETRMLLTHIPFFKELVIMSFSCEHCGERNNEIQPAATLEDFGVKMTLTVTCQEDLQRDIVRSKFATLNIPELGTEIPPSGKGYFSTLEGFLTSFKEDLELNQDERRAEDPEVAQKIEDFLRKLDKYIEGRDQILPFTFIMDDPSGHSNIKNPMAPLEDPNLKSEKYVRSVEQIISMGFSPETAAQSLEEGNKDRKEANTENLPKMDSKDPKKHNYTDKETDELIGNLEKINKTEATKNKNSEDEKPLDAHGMNFKKPFDENLAESKKMKEETLSFDTECHNCGAMGFTRMCTCEIPFFKEIIVMAFTCDICGARSSDVKTGGGISDMGKKITLKVNGVTDMNRDLFKSDTASVEIIELGLIITEGSQGAVYSTVEGLFLKMIETLSENNPFVGDSADTQFVSRFDEFIATLKVYQDGKKAFTMIIDDPLNNSWLQNVCLPDADPKLTEVEYERTAEQEVELGITWLKEEAEKEKAKQAKQELDKID